MREKEIGNVRKRERWGEAKTEDKRSIRHGAMNAHKISSSSVVLFFFHVFFLHFLVAILVFLIVGQF